MGFSTFHSSILPADISVKDTVAHANILLNAFRVAINNGLTTFAMVDGIVDEFEDESGVTTSTGATYDSSNDNYENPTPAGSTEGTFSEGNLSYEEFGAAVGGKNRDHVGHQHVLGATGNVTQMRVDLYSVVSSLTGRASVWTNSADSPTVQIGGDSDGFTWSSSGTKTITWSSDFPSVTAGQTVWLVLSDDGSSEVNLRNSSGTKVNAGATTITGMSLPDGSYGPARFRWEVTITGAASDMTLISDPYTAETEPDEAQVILWEEDVDAVTLNTDLKAWVSIDAGSTWDQATLAETTIVDTGRILTGTADVSARTGTTMLWKITTHNNKELKVHAVGLEWS